jgi:hypothetical protein
VDQARTSRFTLLACSYWVLFGGPWSTADLPCAMARLRLCCTLACRLGPVRWTRVPWALADPMHLAPTRCEVFYPSYSLPAAYSVPPSPGSASPVPTTCSHMHCTEYVEYLVGMRPTRRSWSSTNLKAKYGSHDSASWPFLPTQARLQARLQSEETETICLNIVWVGNVRVTKISFLRINSPFSSVVPVRPHFDDGAVWLLQPSNPSRWFHGWVLQHTCFPIHIIQAPCRHRSV